MGNLPDWVGTVPDWIAAVATVGALLWGVYELRQNNRHRRTEQATGVILDVVTKAEDRLGVPFTVFIVTGWNYSPAMVFCDELLSDEPTEFDTTGYWSTATIQPGKSLQTIIEAPAGATVRFWFDFTDGAGYKWRRYQNGALEPLKERRFGSQRTQIGTRPTGV